MKNISATGDTAAIFTCNLFGGQSHWRKPESFGDKRRQFVPISEKRRHFRETPTPNRGVTIAPEMVLEMSIKSEKYDK